MKLLALDQASIISGYAVFDNDQLIAHGIINAGKGKELGDRLVNLRQQTLKLIETYCIDEIVFEDIQLQEGANNNVETFKALAEVFGVLYELFHELKIPSKAVASGTWRKTLEIKGKLRADRKKYAQEYAAKHYNISCTEDEADAICIGTHYLKKDIEEPPPFNWT